MVLSKFGRKQNKINGGVLSFAGSWGIIERRDFLNGGFPFFSDLKLRQDGGQTGNQEKFREKLQKLPFFG